MITHRSALELEEKRQKLAIDMLQLLNEADDARQVIPRMLDMIRQFGRFDAVSLRLGDIYGSEAAEKPDPGQIDIRIGNNCLCEDHICHAAGEFGQLRIFDRFYRYKNPENSTGSGLGLAIAREIIQAFGGRIWVDSKPGEGACFYFTIPNAQLN